MSRNGYNAGGATLEVGATGQPLVYDIAVFAAAGAAPGSAAVVQRKLQELSSTEGSARSLASARSMALDLVDHVVFIGVLRAVNEASGQGFIQCRETKTLFARDLAVQQTECAGVPVGGEVSFRVQVHRGQPVVCDLAHPPNVQPVSGRPEPKRATNLSGMAAVMQQPADHEEPQWSYAARQWKQSRDAGGREDMDTLLTHQSDGKGRTAEQWRPSSEASDRTQMAAVLAHKAEPQVYPMPPARAGKFVCWQTN
eukprot:TRINITY_DN28994_c0_g1_i1.p1 TRINITY_DN28994_c0_g1~~TRINITY_DN28994_c0_g1_i1.p1  ORF type:complete len:254 (+),score=42.05 TRINITY_DN28994_c0_g1_i1:143-904(+)